MDLQQLYLNCLYLEFLDLQERAINEKLAGNNLGALYWVIEAHEAHNDFWNAFNCLS